MIRIVLILSLSLLYCGCTQTPRQEAKNDKPVKQYVLHGEVVSLDGATQVATIKHEKIGDWMEGMTMGFPVKSKEEFEKLKPGQTVEAEVNVQGDDFWLGRVVVRAKFTPAP